ncbi:MAG TPA: polysaccharide deacetylase [Chloroflexota bacterium]|nr:polysaccharide deacetylase [Chloroflexota bacterium]
MARHLVCLTFDFDVLSSWIFRGQTTPTSLSRGEFGLVGAERILGLLEQHKIRSTWFIPGHTIDTFPESCRQVVERGHEVGHHGYLHEPPAALSGSAEEAAVLERGNEAIKRLTGEYAKGYRSPSWDLSPFTVGLLLQHGFQYDSSMMAKDYEPYRARQGDGIHPDGTVEWGAESQLVEMPISWSLDDFPHFEYRRTENWLQEGLQPTSGVLANFVDDYHYMHQTTDWGVLTYTFHPQVIGRGHRMLMLEKLIHTVRDHGATFVRMDEAAAEWTARRSR